MSDLVGNQIVGFLMRRLIYELQNKKTSLGFLTNVNTNQHIQLQTEARPGVTWLICAFASAHAKNRFLLDVPYIMLHG